VGVHEALDRRGTFGLLMRYEFGRFLIIGTLAALANLLSAWCYRQLFQNTRYYFEASMALGFALGTVISFLLNKFITFQAKDGKT
jgi:putative flippase GtrA